MMEKDMELKEENGTKDLEEMGSAASKAENEAENPENDPCEQEENINVELGKIRAEKTDLINTLQRLQADFENFRRRTRTEKEEMVKFAAESIIIQMLPVVDNFERALGAAKNGGDTKNLAEGVEMIFRQLMQVLTMEGLKPVEAEGCTFDPALHNAVMQVEDDGFEKDTVVEELQKGYTLKGRLIRPSMVKVAK